MVLGHWQVHYRSHSYANGLVQDCSNSSALAVELLQFCTKLLMFCLKLPRSSMVSGHASYSQGSFCACTQPMRDEVTS